jgi:hypothetical protein
MQADRGLASLHTKRGFAGHPKSPTPKTRVEADHWTAPTITVFSKVSTPVRASAVRISTTDTRTGRLRNRSTVSGNVGSICSFWGAQPTRKFGAQADVLKVVSDIALLRSLVRK